jgi:hypothetical protein
MATMRWYRAQAQWISLLAFQVLAFQLALCFAHVHLDAPHSRSGLALLAQRWTVPAAVAVPDEPDAPSQAIRLGDDFCAVCSILHQVGSAAPVAARSLPAPALVSGDPLDIEIDRPRIASPHISFQARAPPLA